jgi:hypothetical protein
MLLGCWSYIKILGQGLKILDQGLKILGQGFDSMLMFIYLD